MGERKEEREGGGGRNRVREVGWVYMYMYSVCNIYSRWKQGLISPWWKSVGKNNFVKEVKDLWPNYTFYGFLIINEICNYMIFHSLL